jgi:hypothetical protein
MAYGQTNSGKTYTILGPQDGRKENWGMLQRAIERIFGLIEFEILGDRDNRFELNLSVFEIYDEKIFDLLGSTERIKSQRLKAIEGLDGTYIKGLSMKKLESLDQALGLMRQAESFRTVAESSYNVNSSRSH